MHSQLEQYLAAISECLWPLPLSCREEEMREIQTHLQYAVASKQEEGVPEDEAVKLVLQQFGSAKAVGKDFVKAWRRGRNKRKEIMMKERIIFGTSLATVLLATAWLAFQAIMISRIPQGRILVLASEGSRLKVQKGDVHVLSAGDYGAGVVHPSLLVPATVLPFVLLFGFAVIGCWSVLQRRRVTG